MEKSPAHARAAAHVADGALRLVQGPVGGQEPGVLVGVGVADHDFLHVVPQHRAVLGQREQVGDDAGSVLQVVERFEQRHRQHPEPDLAGENQRFENVRDTFGHRDDVVPEGERPHPPRGGLHFPNRPDNGFERLGEGGPGRPQRAV